MSHWTGKGDHRHWTDAANWTGGVPGAGVDASFTAGTTEAVSLAAANPLATGALLVSGDTLTLANGVLNLTPMTAQQGNTFDLVVSNAAQVTIAANARLNGSNVAEIGKGTGATLDVLGTVAEEYGVVVGGTLDVTGPDGHWLSGDSGVYLNNATLLVAAGGRVDAGSKLAQYPAASLDIAGNSTATITGTGSLVRLSDLFISESSGTSSLTVQDGGKLVVGGGSIGETGDATLTVTGAGAVFEATRGITIGGQVPVASSLVVEDQGTAMIGQDGLTLDGTLTLDSTASFSAPFILSGGGVIQALSGTVVLASKLELYVNSSNPDASDTTYLDAAPGATLALSGAITSADPGDSMEVLEAATGHIVLSHGHLGFPGTTAIYTATLELATPGALGTGGLAFVGGTAHPGTLQIDAGVTLPNTISGFVAGDTIDLAGFSPDQASFGFTATANGGNLRITDAGQTEVLKFIGSGLSAASFALVSDTHGGTGVIHQ